MTVVIASFKEASNYLGRLARSWLLMDFRWSPLLACRRARNPPNTSTLAYLDTTANRAEDQISRGITRNTRGKS